MPYMHMMLQTRTTLPTYLMHLQSEGRITFTRSEAIAALSLTEGAFLKAAARLQRRGLLLNPRQGFYVVVPPQYLSWGAPPPAWYVDALMNHEGRSYYVGLLKAAELHGATHQAVMEFQVVTDRQLPRIRAGRSFISFHYRKDLKAVRDGVRPHKTDTGSMMVSSPELHGAGPCALQPCRRRSRRRRNHPCRSRRDARWCQARVACGSFRARRCPATWLPAGAPGAWCARRAAA